MFFFALFLTAQALTESALLRDAPRSNMVEMLDRTAETPYVKRALVPFISNAMADITPRYIKRKIAAQAKQVAKLPIIRHMSELSVNRLSLARHYSAGLRKPHNAFRLTVVVGCMVASLMLFFVSLKKIVRLVLPMRPLLPEATMLFGGLMAASLIDYDFKLYDFPALGLTAICLYAMLKGRWLLYFVMFALACINKESAILLVPVYALYYWSRVPRREWLLMVGLQTALWAGIVYTLHVMYAYSPGAYYFHWTTLFILESVRLRPADLVTAVVMFWLIFARWQMLPAFLKAAAITIAGCCGIYFLFGAFREYRVFYEALPAFALLGSYSLYSLIKLPTHSQCLDRKSRVGPV